MSRCAQRVSDPPSASHGYDDLASTLCVAMTPVSVPFDLAVYREFTRQPSLHAADNGLPRAGPDLRRRLAGDEDGGGAGGVDGDHQQPRREVRARRVEQHRGGQRPQRAEEDARRPRPRRALPRCG